ncbi:hypothetical protein C2S51_027311 [Perilla frutescens var. frutescens]|nr:hypothetical protein C2S51_027311 [Perilla frutescens var. frutescens]
MTSSKDLTLDESMVPQSIQHDLKPQRQKHKDDDFLCRGHILNALSDSVYSVHQSIESAKELWNTLDAKYDIEEKIDLMGDVEEANSVGTDDGWWLDTGATVHICNDESKFKTYNAYTDGREVKMVNGVHAKVAGIGNIDLKLSSEKLITLTDVLHVGDMVKNLISGD